ncbi:MAG: D-2-hydroxyacid dehydrogenase [Bacteroidales bacterium]|jgi:glycerate dehydrogenase|nr:D-2-hydroxyacid dehydrogenase [Bacteroidales bacterium]
MEIVFLDAATIGDVPNLDEIKKLGEYTSYENTMPEESIHRLRNADIVIVNKVLINKEVMDACPNLKLVCVSATGMNNVDLEYAGKKGIEVKNVAGYSTNSVAQVTFSLILEILVRTHYYNDYIQSGKYSSSSLFTHFGPSFWELNEKQMGIIGLGAIGGKVADIAGAFGAKICYHSTSGKNMDRPYKHLSLEELLQTSDIVSIHAPLNDQTLNLIDLPQLQLMKRSALLINVGRGGIVNETALAKAIDEGMIAGAGSDVFTREPLPEDHPFLKVKKKENLLLLPHIAWASLEARSLLVSRIAGNIKKYMADHPDLN